ncbi:MAG: long-chain fatty acid--CoA ligase [Solirubrobacteraceae bacterium]|nr:long-chain fatty acid--CoA ligase [Solirubrobacteraceae bacterium]
MTAVPSPSPSPGAATATTLAEAFATTVAAQPDAVAVRTLDGSTAYSWRELDRQARRFASGLAGLGVGPGDSVGVMLTNDLPFYVADLAAVFLGAVPVPIYATASPEQIAHVAEDAHLKAAVTQESLAPSLLAGLEDRSDCPVVCVEAGVFGTVPWAEVAAAEPLAPVHAAAPDELLTIIYTSGTTGASKGVELTHGAVLASAAAVSGFAGMQEGGTVISWLPLAHIAERVASYYMAITCGLEVVVCPDPKRVAEYLPQVQPSFFFAVPRFWEKLRGGIEAKVAGLPEEAQEAFAAREPGLMGGLRQLIGFGELKVAAIGAAPSDPELIEFFHELGVPLGEIYGMTENAACCTANPRDAIRIGSAGVPMPGTEVRIAADGEVEMRGPVLMRGYRGLPDQTADAFTVDGFLRTGDIGRLDDDGYLWIFDRKKDVMINSGGKNMSPSNIEAAIKSGGPEIGHVCVVGDARAYNVALVVPDPDVVGLPHEWPADLEARIAAAVAAGNARLSRVEQVKRYHLVRDVWEPGSDLLTPTLKLRRPGAHRLYATEIDALYSAE